ncbi:MAG: glutamate racemase [Sulfuritalea sp.]|nr:glutamate racemase [Sulfuritalea sp.]
MIGVFDSGLGGLSVLAALMDALPQADFVYYADTAHMPYGNKTEEFITRRVLEIGELLVAQGCTLVVVACNTATAASVQILRATHPGIPIVGIEPGIKPAALASATRRIAVLATEATSRSDRLARLIREHAENVEVRVVPCPGWATHVEMLQLNDPALATDVRARIEPLLAQGVDRIVLGCTHYSFIAPLLADIIGTRAQLVDVAEAVARQAQRLAGDFAHGSGRLQLQASSCPQNLPAALPRLGLDRIIPRVA